MTSTTDKPLPESINEQLKIKPDQQEAISFIKLLIPGFTSLTFQTAPDAEELKQKGKLGRTIYLGPGSSLGWGDLERANLAGYGIHLTVNETRGTRRKAEDVTRIRAVWSEVDDGKPRDFPLPPSIIVRTSRIAGTELFKYHAYWFLDDGDPLTFEEFGSVMKTMVAKHGCDPGALGINRALRLPGTLHMKGVPQLVTFYVPGSDPFAGDAEADYYSREDIVAAFPPTPEEAKSEPREYGDVDVAKVKSAMDAIPVSAPPGEDPDKAICRDSRLVWRNVGMALKLHFGEFGRLVWDEWSEASAEYNEAEQQKAWDSFKRDSKEKAVKVGTIFRYARECGWQGYKVGSSAAAVPQGTAVQAYVWPYMKKLRNGGEVVHKLHIENTAYLLAQYNVTVRHNEFSGKVEISGLRHAAELNEAALNLLWAVATAHGFEPTIDTLFRHISTLADRGRYHPVRDYLERLDWDGKPRVDGWLTTYLGADDTELNRSFGLITLLGAVRRVLRPGWKHDTILVLEGIQGNSKGSAIEILGGEWYSDALKLGTDAKQTIEVTRGSWIIETPELSGMRSRDVEAVKAMLSTKRDRARLVWERTTADIPRQFVLIGTTNDGEYLRDETGNRRFLNVACGKIDLEALRRDRDQLWAEAYHRVKQKDESNVLPERLWAEAAKLQESRMVSDPVREKLIDWFDGRAGRVAKEDVYGALGYEKPKDVPAEAAKRIGTIMRKLGWAATHGRRKGRFLRCFKRADTGAEPPWLAFSLAIGEFAPEESASP